MYLKGVRNIVKNAHRVKRVTSLFGRLRRRNFAYNRRAISPVISSMILVAVVIVLGFSALAYARSIASNYESQYQENVSDDIARLKETLSFEYVYYSTGHLSIYFMNAGSNSFEVDKVYLSTSTAAIEPSLKEFSGGIVPNKILGVGDERLIDISTSTLERSSYTVKITTVRGSSFEYTFMV